MATRQPTSGELRHKAPLPSVCTVETCERPAYSRVKGHNGAFCRMHLCRISRNGSVESRPTAKSPLPELCTVEGCETRPHSRVTGVDGAFCYKHERLVRQGRNPLEEPRRPPLPKNCTVPGCSSAAYSRVSGFDHAFCGFHARRVFSTGTYDKDLQPSIFPSCQVEGCDKPANRKKKTICEMHFGRMLRKGSYEPREIMPRVRGGSGYWIVKNPKHPLSRKDGSVAEHRLNMFDEIGPGPHPCHWCSKTVHWRGRPALVVDHVDGDIDHNDTPNLVPSCHICNSTRTHAIAWLSRMSPRSTVGQALKAITHKRTPEAPSFLHPSNTGAPIPKNRNKR